MSEANDDKGVSVDIHLHLHFSQCSKDDSNMSSTQEKDSQKEDSWASEMLRKAAEEEQAISAELQQLSAKSQAIHKSIINQPEFRVEGLTFHEINRAAFAALKHG